MIIQGYEISGRLPMFTAENRQKNRDGIKTMTRRIVKQAYDKVDPSPPFAVCRASDSGWIAWYGQPREDIEAFTKKAYRHGFECPYGKPGQYRVMTEPLIHGPDDAYYKDDGQPVFHAETGERIKWRWKRDVLSSLFMPMEAARSVFLIEDIKVEQLGEISEEDIEKEGIDVTYHEGTIATGVVDLPNGNRRHSTALYCFESLWRSIHGPGSWERDKDKWVWAISYKKEEN